MSALASIVYKTILKRSPTLLLVAVVGAVFVEEGIDYIGATTFNRVNEGKLWDHIKHKYEKSS